MANQVNNSRLQHRSVALNIEQREAWVGRDPLQSGPSAIWDPATGLETLPASALPPAGMLVSHGPAPCSQHFRLPWGSPRPGPTLLREVSGDCGLTLARLYGDESELHFWTVAAHYLHSLSQEKAASTPVVKEAVPRDRVNNPLDICYDVLCENAYFQVLCFIH